MIEVQGLNKTYGQKQVLANVSFRAENGLVVVLRGPSPFMSNAFASAYASSCARRSIAIAG